MQMNESSTSRLYDLWAKFYDGSFGRLVYKHKRRAIEQLQLQAGQRVLDLGVGTGMILAHYPAEVTAVGMDLSAGMLAKAAGKIRRLQLDHCHLVQADAMQPPFAAGSFDHVLISHTISVVSDPARLVQWASRLVKPNGRIVVLNHFLSSNPILAWWERIMNPIFVKIGWRSDLSLDECLGDVDLRIQDRFRLSALDFWQIVVLIPGKRPDTQTPPATELPRGQLAIEG